MAKRKPKADTKHLQGFGERIKKARKNAGHNQKELMELLGWPNESNSRMSGYENEERRPTLEDFEAIAKLCHVDPAWLAFGDFRLEGELPQVVTGFQNADEHNRDVVRAALRITARNNQKRAAD